MTDGYAFQEDRLPHLVQRINEAAAHFDAHGKAIAAGRLDVAGGALVGGAGESGDFQGACMDFEREFLDVLSQIESRNMQFVWSLTDLLQAVQGTQKLYQGAEQRQSGVMSNLTRRLENEE